HERFGVGARGCSVVARRSALGGAASGQHAHHHAGRPAPRDPARALRAQHRPLREHVERLDSHRARRGGARRSYPPGRHRAHVRAGRRSILGERARAHGNRARLPSPFPKEQLVKLALSSPGQGSQVVGMGQALAASSEAAKRTFEAADRALGRSISKLCFEGPDAELALTFNTQPALVTTSMAVLAAIRERYPDLPTPAFAAGHSLGEYTALVAASALALEDAVRLVELRGRAMQDAVPPGEGAMAAILGG